MMVARIVVLCLGLGSIVAGLAASAPAARAGDLPQGYWPQDSVRAILDKTLVLRLAPDLSGLKPAERKAVEKLLAVGQIFQRLYEEQLHHQARAARRDLESLDRRLGSPRRTKDLLDLYRLFQGPIATTLDNRRVPFLPVDPYTRGKSLYPWGQEKPELDAFLEEHPALRPSILDVRSVVRRAQRAALAADLATLRERPVLATLHPGLAAELQSLLENPGARQLYAVPYAVAYAREMLEAHRLLWEAADLVEQGDADFADYLRQRARDLLANDYEAGDAAWVSGRFGRLNAQLGAYETYDDALNGVKSFFGASLLLRDEERTAELSAALKGLQQLEDSLPYEPHKTVRSEIPVGVYDVIADFGQARGTNTASILPNESHLTRKYGRTILLRRNIMTSPELFALALADWKAALAPEHHAELTPDGEFMRTLWHEVGHYLGPQVDAHGRALGEALEEDADLMEELKADLVSLFVAPALRAGGFLDDTRLRAVEADGIYRVLQKVRPLRSQPYQSMELMQLNYFLERGLLSLEGEPRRLRIHHDRYHEVVTAMLREVLAIQAAGSKADAEAFIARYSTWDERHERLARALREAERYRYRLVRYAALGE